MAASFVTALSPKAQLAAVTRFADFYLAGFDRQQLDIVAQYDHLGTMASINDWLMVDPNLRRQVRLAELVKNRYEDLLKLLSEIEQQFDANGISEVAWPQWQQQQRQAIPQGR